MNVLLVTKTLAEFPEEVRKVREIARLGVRVSVVVPSTWRGKAVNVRRLEGEGYEVLGLTCLFSNRDSKKIRNHLHFYRGISNLFGSQAWDVIHIDEEPMNFSTYHALKGCRGYNIPVVFTTWQNVMKFYPPPFGLFEDFVFENSFGAFAGNADALQVLRERGFTKPVACVPQHGVDPEMFRKQDAANMCQGMRPSNSFLIGYVGQIGYWKGLDTLVRALALLPKQCILVFIGSGPGKSKLKILIRELGLTERVQWEPWLDQSEVSKFMCSFDAFVLASRTRRKAKEQFGRVLIEAMACETPVVGSDSGEIPNVIGDAGLIFHEGDERDLAGHLRRLMEDPALRASLGRRGRERVLERFTYAKVAEQTVAFYKRICNGNE